MYNGLRLTEPNLANHCYRISGLTVTIIWTIRACPYFKLKNECISVEDYQSIKQVFGERGMNTFADWREYYNNLDAEPFLEA